MLRTEFPLWSIITRIGVTVFAMLFIYLTLGPPTYKEADSINMLMYGLLLPLIAIPCTILACFLIGTPIRAISKVFNWWYNRPYIALLLLITGIIFCLLSVNEHFIQSYPVAHGSDATITLPNDELLYAGWFTTAFALLHFYPESLSRYFPKKRSPWD